jgi:signal transduction histidine kinase
MMDAQGLRLALRRIGAACTSEPWWLRGLNWRRVGFAAALAVILAASFWIHHLLPGDGDELLPPALIDVTVNAITGLAVLLIATILSNIARPRVPVPIVLAIAVVAGALIGQLFMVVQNFGDLPARFTSGAGLAMFALLRARLIAMPWALAAAAWYFLHRAGLRASALRAAEIDRRRLETGMIEARLQALEAQVEPHFLFNTLAHIKRLYRTDPARARAMLDSFRVYLRSALPQLRDMNASLGREIDISCAYLKVQQIRMGRRLEVNVDVPKGLRSCPFPPMMLMSLVENAIKHGLNPLPQGGAISMSAIRIDQTLRVTIADTGRGMGDQLGTGIGLSNIRDRLTTLFGPDARLSLIRRSPRGVAATIEIPFTESRADAANDATHGATLATLVRAEAA